MPVPGGLGGSRNVPSCLGGTCQSGRSVSGTRGSRCHVFAPAGDLTPTAPSFYQESRNLFCCLYRSWCHNPVTTVSLCFLTQNYKHAYDLIQKLYPLGVFRKAGAWAGPLVPLWPPRSRCGPAQAHHYRGGVPAMGGQEQPAPFPSGHPYFLWCKKR